MRDLLTALVATLDARRACVHCAVIGTRGSTPQKPGAGMLVLPDGSQFGTLGGGCVEAEVKRRALGVLLGDGGHPEVQTFHLDDNFGWDDGLICGGQMTILIHPLHPDTCDRDADFYRRLHAFAEAGRGFTDAVVISPTGSLVVGDRYLFDAEGALAACLAEHPEPETVASHLPALAGQRRAVLQQGIAYLPTQARVTVLLVGGGHVGQAVAVLAAQAGFRIEVLDDREAYANPQRFPFADHILVGDIGAALSELAPSLTSTTYVLVMTRGHNHDEEALAHLVGSGCGYLGMIGSRRKARLIFEDLTSRGARAEDLARVRSPIGLDIGAQTVFEIAVSIVAELICCRNLGPDRVPSWESHRGMRAARAAPEQGTAS
jgi:xanthine dehydrogenase accessory factor